MSFITDCHVNVERDPTLGVNKHLVVPPPPAPPFIAPALEVPVIQHWIPGYYCPQLYNKFSKTVKHKGQQICLGGHNIGPLILDLTYPVLPNINYLKQWPLSRRAMTFAASTVTMNGLPVGCSQAPFYPMLTCGEPYATPTSFPVVNLMNTLKVSMTWQDIAFGLLTVGISLLVDRAFKVEPPGGGAAAGNGASAAAKGFAKAGVRASAKIGLRKAGGVAVSKLRTSTG